MDCDPLLPNSVLGSCPTSSSNIERLKSDFGITAVLNVQTDEGDGESGGGGWFRTVLTASLKPPRKGRCILIQ